MGIRGTGMSGSRDFFEQNVFPSCPGVCMNVQVGYFGGLDAALILFVPVFHTNPLSMD
jgi:hypothetical protein